MVQHKDVVLGLLGASSALVGFVLVFLGLIVNRYQALPGDVPQTVRRPFQRVGSVALATFILGLVAIVLTVTWLVHRQTRFLYDTSIVLFAMQLIGLAVSSVWTAKELLWD